jgi:hypothetical protein
VTGLIYLSFYLFKIKVLGAGNIGEAVGLLAFIKIIVEAVFGLFISAVVLFIISSICKGNTNIEANIRVTSSLMAILPVYSILSVSWALNIYFGLVISIIMVLYFLWLLYYGLTESLKCNKKNAKLVCYVLMGLVVIFLLLSVKATVGNSDKDEEVRNPKKELIKN